jgi:hypothetical protein
VNVEKITRVMDLAEKVTNRAHTVLADAPEGFFIVGTKATGALRRISMELTSTRRPAEAQAGRSDGVSRQAG